MRRPDPIRMVWESDKQYLKALEKYCDELEKALGNTCDMLAIYDLANQFEMTRAPRSDEEWKEWSFNERK